MMGNKMKKIYRNVIDYISLDRYTQVENIYVQ